MSSEPSLTPDRPWYAEVTSYQWLVLIIASAGWIFDIYENQIFGVTRGPMLQELLRVPADSPLIKYYGDLLLGAFLVGGAAGGVFFGWLGDRRGRGLSMVLSILVYATFTALTAAAHSVTQVAILRFFVATGTGGEWAVAAALVAEIFPARSRAHASGIFHASSVLGISAAAGAGMLAGAHWRITYLIGLLPALLVLAVRFHIREPQGLKAAGEARGSLAALWADANYRRRATLGLLLAAVGLAGYWGVFVAGQDLAKFVLLRTGLDPLVATKKSQFLYGVMQNIGAGVGLFAMGPLCAALGRRRAFMVAQAAVLAIVPLTCFCATSYSRLMLFLPLYGLCVSGMHAGYAVYFPELFPGRFRATGAGLCFNGGRLVAAPMLWFSASLKAHWVPDLRWAITLLSMIYVLGIVFVYLMPETKGKALEA